MLQWIDTLRVRFVGILETIRQSYGFIPALMATLAGIVATGLVVLDHRHESEWLEPIPWLGTLSAESCRSILQAVAGSSITVAGTVYSVMIVALTLASSQFGPRLLRTFLRDRGNQVALGTFVATFVYALLVLTSVRDENVPRVATTGAVVLAVISVAVLVFVLHRASTSIQASSLIAAVSDEIVEQLGRLPEIEADEETEVAPEGERRAATAGYESEEDVRRSATVVAYAERGGYLQAVDVETLLRLAGRSETRIELLAAPGDFVLPGSPLARLFGEMATDEQEELAVDVVEACTIGSTRSTVQDHGFLLDQLVEMALRALSPGINDPETAVACIHRLGSALCLASARSFPEPFCRDDDGEIRLERPVATFASLAQRSFDPIRRAGVSQPGVAVALLETIGEVARQCRARRGDGSIEARAMRELGDAVWEHFGNVELAVERDRRLVEEAYFGFTSRFTSRARPGDAPQVG